MPSSAGVCGENIAVTVRILERPALDHVQRPPGLRTGGTLTKPIPPLDLSWLLIESPAGTTYVGAMLLFKKPAGRRSIVREIVEASRAYPPAPPFNYVPEAPGSRRAHFREAASWDPHYHIGYLALPTGASKARATMSSISLDHVRR